MAKLVLMLEASPPTLPSGRPPSTHRQPRHLAFPREVSDRKGGARPRGRSGREWGKGRSVWGDTLTDDLFLAPGLPDLPALFLCCKAPPRPQSRNNLLARPQDPKAECLLHSRQKRNHLVDWFEILPRGFGLEDFPGYSLQGINVA